MNKETADVRAQCAVAFRHGLSMNQIYRLVAILSVVTFVQGCEFMTVVGALNGLNAVARVTAGSSVNTSGESVENSGSMVATTAPGDAEIASVDVSGTYISEITVSGNASGTKNFLKKKNRKEIILKQTGNIIIGFDDSRNLKINGTREGNTINFYIVRGNEIEGTWEIGDTATKLAGKWNTNGAGGASGMWNLTRVGPAEYISENQSATDFDLTGTYVSDRIDANWALRYKSRLQIKLKQNLGSIEGEFFKSLNGPIRGSIVGDIVEVTWEAGNCSSGEGTLYLDPDGPTLTGALICRSQGMSKYDIVFRRM